MTFPHYFLSDVKASSNTHTFICGLVSQGMPMFWRGREDRQKWLCQYLHGHVVVHLIGRTWQGKVNNIFEFGPFCFDYHNISTVGPIFYYFDINTLLLQDYLIHYIYVSSLLIFSSTGNTSSLILS